MKKTLLIASAVALVAVSVSAGEIKFERTFRAALPSGTYLTEDFEGSDNTAKWLPEGWTTQSRGDLAPEGDNIAVWHVQNRTSAYFPAPFGTYYAVIGYQTDNTANQDEWLISPEFTVSDNNQLSYYLWLDPSSLFDGIWNVTDRDESLNLPLLYNVEVYLIADDTENKVQSIADRYTWLSINELISVTPTGLTRFTCDLSAYAGKQAKVAFRFTGHDANYVFLDNVRVGLPEANAYYSLPYTTLFAGTACNSGWTMAGDAVAVYPPYEDLYFMADYEDEATYTWEYSGGSETGDMLTINQKPTFDGTACTMPVLTVSAEGKATSTYADPSDGYIVGGHAFDEITDTQSGETTVLDYSLLPFSPIASGLDIHVEEAADFGQPSIPIFGHSDDTNAWWTDHTFYGDTDEGNNAEITSICNMYFATAQPIVIDKLWLLAKANILEGATMTARIIQMNEDFEPQPDKVIAEATCLYEDMMIVEGGMREFVNIPFSFSEPVVISTDVCPYYIVEITGFNNDKYPWFAPVQQAIPNGDYGLCQGWLFEQIDTPDQSGISFVPIANFYNEYGQEMRSAFAINLGASYPYLKPADEDAGAPVLSEQNPTAEVALLSYYTGTDVTIDIPEGFEAEVTGRYDAAKLSIDALPGAPAGKFTAKLTVPGLELDVPFTSDGRAGIAGITTGSVTVKAIYTTDGQLTGAASAEDLPAGIYIVTYSDGTVAKILR